MLMYEATGFTTQISQILRDYFDQSVAEKAKDEDTSFVKLPQSKNGKAPV